MSETEWVQTGEREYVSQSVSQSMQQTDLSERS